MRTITDKYVMRQDGEIEPCDDLMEWARWFECTNRRIDQTFITKDNIEIRISTVFLGLDHSFGEGPPLVFETMIFKGMHDGHQERCSTYKEALAMHKRAVDLATWSK